MSDRAVISAYRAACSKAKSQAEELRRRIAQLESLRPELESRLEALKEEKLKLESEAGDIERLAELLDLRARQEEMQAARVAASEPRPA